MKKNSLLAIFALTLSTAAFASETQLSVTVTGVNGETLHKFETLTSHVRPNLIEMTDTSHYIAEYETKETSKGEITIVEPGEYKTGHIFDFIAHEKPGGDVYVSISGVKMELVKLHEIEGAVEPEIRQKPYKILETIKVGEETSIPLGCTTKGTTESCDFTFKVKSRTFEL